MRRASSRRWWLRAAGVLGLMIALVLWTVASSAPPPASRSRPLVLVLPTPQLDPWALWTARLRDPAQFPGALAEASRWVRQRRDETLLVLLHIAQHGVGAVWRPDPVVARILLSKLHAGVPEMLLPTLDVAPEDLVGEPIPWPADIVAPPPRLPSPPAPRAARAAAPPEAGIWVPPPEVWAAVQEIAGSQNVHEHAVLASAAQGAARLRELPRGESVASETLAALLAERSDEEARAAYRVLESLQSKAHSRFGISERDALERVWKRIHDPVNAERRADLVETLIKSLASGVEDDAVVCSTGRIMRIFGALDGADAEGVLNLRSDAAVNEELRQLVATQRDRVLAGWDAAKRARYEEDEEGVMRELRDAIRASAHATYATLLAPAVLDGKLDELLAFM